LGLHLVCAAQAKFIEAGYRIGQVVTQLDNVAACRLYEKCGYHLEKLENFYHFWL
jgi:dTDP-4-amino-4,6-dideoxy-D-galactose acyltransferase